jgi:hypothetical protein
MALPFPLSLANLFNGLAKAETRFFLGEATSVTETQGGEILQAAYGARLWQGSITVRGNPYVDLDSLLARAELLMQAGASFRVSQSVRSGPLLDPEGIALGGAMPTITAVAGNNRDITLAGLPAGYVLSQGDLMSFQYLSAPVRHALHRIVTSATANGSGVIGSVEVMPPLRAGFATPIAIDLISPSCKAVIVPGSFKDPATSRAVKTTFSFDWRQTLR